MFNVNWKPDDNDENSGTITSYQEGPDRSGNVAEDGTRTTSFPYQVKGMFNEHGICQMRIEGGKLVWLNPVEIPDPLPNPPNAAA